MSAYYNPNRLLSTLDINGKKPEIYLCTANRTAGKTTAFNRLLVNRWLKKGKKFVLLYRYKYELNECSEKFFKDIEKLFFSGYQMESKKRCDGVYHDLFINDEHCGYALAINCAEKIKKMSHIFNDVDAILLDEFQSENNEYCPNEVQKFISIHTSIARGNGEQVRFVPVYLIGNSVSLLNPYFVSLGISDRLKNDTKILKGDGFVLEQGYVDSASKAQTLSGFNRAFSKNEYISYSSQNIYLNDNQVFIDKVKGNGRYFCTLRYKKVDYGVRIYDDLGVVFCNKRPDLSNGVRISVTTDDHNVNYVMLKSKSGVIDLLRFFFDKGCFRFSDLQAKECVLNAISY